MLVLSLPVQMYRESYSTTPVFGINDIVYVSLKMLTHCSQETRKRVTGKYAASDQGLHCLQTVHPFFSRNICLIAGRT